MANATQILRPTKVNLDKHPKVLTEEEAWYLLNHETHVNPHSGNAENLGKSTPMQANFPACVFDSLPAGENFRNGNYRSPVTNELYSWIYNTNNNHFIKRINSSGNCEIVYDEPCLKLSADPRHSIEDYRAYMKLDEVKCKGRHGKYLIWVNGDNEDMGYVDVEASIATNSFTTPFFDICHDPCAMISMCVPKTCGCITGEFVPLDPDDEGKTNNMVDISFKFAYRLVYYDDRASDYSGVSSLYWQNSKGCFSGAEGFPRCIKLRLPLGNPMVDRIELIYSTDNGVTWQLYDTIEKYGSYSSTVQWWYERSLNSDLEIDPADECYFFYLFCNDKQCNEVDPVEVGRVFNPTPRKAQGILPVKGLLGVYNYEQGNCPLPSDEIKKFDIEIEDVTDGCHSEMVTVKVRAVIHNRRDGDNQFVWRYGGDRWTSPDDKSDAAWFGAIERDSGYPPVSIMNSHDQRFYGDHRNFVAYIEGLDMYEEMEQWMCDNGFTNSHKTGIVSGMTNAGNNGGWLMSYIASRFYYQEAVFKVKKGTRGVIRLQSHLEPNNNSDTSTFVIGATDIRAYASGSNYDALINTPNFEVEFDTCSTPAGGTLELYDAFVIEDHAVENQTTAFFGYVKDNNGKPPEGMGLYDNGGQLNGWTDHNGFYHMDIDHPDDGSNWVGTFRGEMSSNCATPFQDVATRNFTQREGGDFPQDVTIGLTAFNDFYGIVKVTVKDCDNIPVSGIIVSASGSKYAITDALGEARIRVRQYSSRNRVVKVFIMDANSCFNVDCLGNCNPCMGSGTVNLDCSLEYAVGVRKTFGLDIQLNKDKSISNISGLKKGGLYEWFIVAKGKCGRISSSYSVASFSIPKLQVNSIEGFATFKYDAGNIVLPDWVDCLEILRSENLTPFVIQWIVDKIERTSDGKIKITIQSLNDYNAKFGFKTNTVYKWLDGDRIEFIRDDLGSILTVAANGLLNYQTINPIDTSTDTNKTNDADYFNQVMIIDDGRLDHIKEGSIIEIQRSKTCQSDEPTGFEICVSLEVLNGSVVHQTGTFTTFDTFFVERSIGSKYKLKFEHRYPSDFWSSGSDNGLSDIGRAHFVNKYETEKRFGRKITFNSASQFNYFGGLIKTFDNPEHGDITFIGIKDGRIILVISENDNSTHEAADDLVRVVSDGTIRALPADAIISDGQPKLSGVFGCQYPHIGSIFFGDGFVLWRDVNKGAYVKHDYSSAVDVSIGKFQSLCKRQSQEMQLHNSNEPDVVNHFRFCTGINMHTGKVMLTIKSLRQSGIYNYTKLYQETNNTIVFDPSDNELATFASFTPEGYGYINIFDGDGCAFVTFLNAVPYIHPINSVNFNEFYGVAVDRVVGVSLNKFQEKIKVAISTEIQDEMMWFISEVTTDNINFVSEIPPIRMKKQENKWVASFLGNKSGIGGLYGRGNARGYFINVTFVRDNTNALAYGSVDNSKRVLYDELDLIIFKFLMSEQSGFTENI